MIDGKWGRLGMWVAPWYDNWVFVCLFVNKTIFCWNVFYFDIWRLKGSGEWLPICQFRYVRAKGESLSLWEIQTSSFHFLSETFAQRKLTSRSKHGISWKAVENTFCLWRLLWIAMGLKLSAAKNVISCIYAYMSSSCSSGAQNFGQ